MSHKTVVPISLDIEADRDIIRWLDRQPPRKRSQAVRDVLHQHISGSVSVGDVYEIVARIERKIERGVIVDSSPVGEDDDHHHEHPDVVAALDVLGSL